jgi:hypothetical protein
MGFVTIIFESDRIVNCFSIIGPERINIPCKVTGGLLDDDPVDDGVSRLLQNRKMCTPYMSEGIKNEKKSRI